MALCCHHEPTMRTLRACIALSLFVLALAAPWAAAQEVVLAAWRFPYGCGINATQIHPSVNRLNGISETYYKGFSCHRNWNVDGFQCNSNGTTQTEALTNQQAFYMAFGPTYGYAHKLTRVTFDITGNAVSTRTRAIMMFSMVAYDFDLSPADMYPTNRYLVSSYIQAIPYTNLSSASVYPSYQSFEAVYSPDYPVTWPTQSYNFRWVQIRTSRLRSTFGRLMWIHPRSATI